MFDPNSVPESKDSAFTLLPKGGYRVIVAGVEFKHKTGDVNSNWFNVRFDIIPFQGAGEYELAGRRIYNNYTWENPNSPQAREIGRQQLADLQFAADAFVAFNHPQDLSALLMNKELFVEIYHSKRKDTGDMEARIGGYWGMSGKQRKKNPKPIPVPPTSAAIASAPAQAPKNNAPQAYGAQSTHPAFDNDVPF